MSRAALTNIIKLIYSRLEAVAVHAGAQQPPTCHSGP